MSTTTTSEQLTRRKQEIDNSPKVVAEKRRIKKELKAKIHAERVKKYKLLGKLRKEKDL